MNKHETIDIYNRRIAAAIEYIDQHLDEDLELSTIAYTAHFSPFHFHRIFRAFRGEAIGAYITRIRVEKAARLLRGGDLPVETIAYMVGFGTPSSLTKAFRALYDTTPSDYRSSKIPHTMKTSQTNSFIKFKAPRIVELEPKTALCVPFTGDYKQLDYSGAFSRMWAIVKSQGLFSAGIEHLCVFRNDPKITAASDLRTDVCLVVKKTATPQDGIELTTIAGGRYAVFTHIGSYNDVQPVYDAIYGEWVPANCTCGDDCDCPPDECRCALRDEPVFEKYINDPARVAPEKLKTEIYIPIK